MSSLLAAIYATVFSKLNILSPIQSEVSVRFIQSSVQFLEKFKDENFVLEKISGPRSGSTSKNFIVFNPKNCF
jgi:hypothetical protein